MFVVILWHLVISFFDMCSFMSLYIFLWCSIIIRYIVIYCHGFVLLYIMLLYIDMYRLCYFMSFCNVFLCTILYHFVVRCIALCHIHVMLCYVVLFGINLRCFKFFNIFLYHVVMHCFNFVNRCIIFYFVMLLLSGYYAPVN